MRGHTTALGIVEGSSSNLSAACRAILGVACLCALLLGCALIGAVAIDLEDVWRGEAQASFIFYQLRLPRVFYAFLVGGALALSGLIVQILFRNELATPFTLGISGGASLGVALCMIVGSLSQLPGGLTIAGFIGAIGTVVLVSVLGGGRRFSTVSLLLAGVMLNFLFASIVMFLQFIADPHEVVALSRWGMGSLRLVGTQQLFISSVPCLLLLLYGLWTSRDLAVLTMGEELARAKGVRVRFFQWSHLLLSALAVATVVSTCGIISFVGLVVPFCLRLLFSTRVAVLVPLSFLVGGTFLVVCDTLARTLLAPAELPVGIITALCGAPLFLFLLVKRTP